MLRRRAFEILAGVTLLAIALPICAGIALYYFYFAKLPSRSDAVSADDLAQVLRIYHFVVVLPRDVGPKEFVQAALVSSSGEVVVGTEVWIGGGKKGDKVKVFCWDEAEHMKLMIATRGESGTTDVGHNYFKDATTSWNSDGKPRQLGDILLRFRPNSERSFKNELGLRVVIATH